MYKKDFDNLTEIPHSVVFFGNDFYLKEYEKKIISSFSNANILKMYYDEYDFEEAKAHLRENSLFGNQNVLIVKHNKNIPELDKLMKYAKDSYFFFFYYGNKPLKIKNSVRFFEPDIKELMYFIDKKSKELNINLTKEAKLYLIKSVEAVFLEKELEKLALYSKELTLDDVKELVFLYKEETFENIIVSILKGEDFEERLDNLLQKIDVKRFISALIKYIKELYKYHLYIKKTGNTSLKELLGYQLPLQIEKQRIDLAVKFKEKDFYYLLKNLLFLELKLREGKGFNEGVFLEIIAFLKVFNSF